MYMYDGYGGCWVYLRGNRTLDTCAMYKRNVVSIQVSLNPAESATSMHLTNETTTNTLFAKQSTPLGQSSLLQAPWRPYFAAIGLGLSDH
jgi:hypothetical protein